MLTLPVRRYDPSTERGAWDVTGSYAGVRLASTKSGTITTKVVAETSITNDYGVLLPKAVSEPIPSAQTISGTLNWILGVLESI